MNEDIGVIIVSHGQFGAAMLKAAEDILGAQSDCVAISVDVTHEVEESVRRLNDAVSRLDTGAGVIALTDMFGGTPTNITLSMGKNHNVEIVTGMNLPMVLKVFESRGSTALPELAAMAGAAGKAGIVVAADMLRGKTKGAPQ